LYIVTHAHVNTRAHHMQSYHVSNYQRHKKIVSQKLKHRLLSNLQVKVCRCKSNQARRRKKTL